MVCHCGVALVAGYWMEAEKAEAEACGKVTRTAIVEVMISIGLTARSCKLKMGVLGRG